MRNSLKANQVAWLCLGLGVLVGVSLWLRVLTAAALVVGGFYLYWRGERWLCFK